ncbi:MAG: GSCFA domain-containing protein [Bacteroidota bacterium]
MDSFRTEILPEKINVEISHQHPILCIGSCFAENIGRKLNELKFPVLINPFGIVYNPISIVSVLEKIISKSSFAENDLFQNLGLYHSFAHHGRFSHPDKLTALQQINNSLQEARIFLNKTNRLVLTLGTAHVFIYKNTNEIVANCHKVAGQEFLRKRLSVAEIQAPLINVFKKLKAQLPLLEIIVTVSPVRHLRDGLVENQRSKAALVLGLDEVCRQLEFVHYFPSYEIVLDDLRDYRFYEKDLSHPNEMAVDYIWKKFEHLFFNEGTKNICRQILSINNAAKHRPFHPASEAHQRFLKKQLELIDQLEKKYAFLNFKKEKNIFEGQLV